MAQELEAPESASVFDFLYVDHHRIGLFLSQFSEFGHLTEIVHTRSNSSDSTFSAGMKPILGADSKAGSSEGRQSKYNTQWSQALNFLDEVNARDMVEREIGSAQLGGLLLAAGSLSLLNMRAMERSWSVAADIAQEPVAKSPIPTGSRNARKAAQARREQEVAQPTGGSGGLRLLGSLDQPVMMALASPQGRLWSTLEPDFLIGGPSALTLKQGVAIAGTWHVLGILDCLPGELASDETEIGRICGGGDNVFSDAAVGMWRELGYIFGRPADCYGITPIMIMREIKRR